MNNARTADVDLAGARWIDCFDEKAEHRRSNGYVCFRKTFSCPEAPDEALLHITADYRYTVWVNGEWIGQGPVRGWPQSYFYDTYEMSRVLRPGVNAIAVLLHTLEVATFQYIPASNPGFAARLSGGGMQMMWSVVTDASWICSPHPSLTDNTPRISTQQAFVEHFDARREPEGWKLPEFSVSLVADPAESANERSDGTPGWRHAREADEMPVLKPRDIPHLTCEEMYPVSLREASVVMLPLPAWSMDLRRLLLPAGAAQDANPHPIRGMVATTVKADRPMSVRFRFQDRTSGLNTRMSVNGVALIPIDDSGSHWSGLFHYDATLGIGENLLLFRFDGLAHEFTFQAAVEIITSEIAKGTSDHSDADEPIPCLPDIVEGRFAFCNAGGDSDEDGVVWTSMSRAVTWDDWRTAADGRWSILPRAAEHDGNVFLSVRHAWPSESVDGGRPTEPTALPITAADFRCCGGNGEAALIDAPPERTAFRLVFEFEKMTAGLIEFELFGQDGATIDFYGFEAYQGNAPVHMDSMHNTMRYVCRQGWQSYRSLTHRSFRYLAVQFSGFRGQIRLKSIRCLLRTYPAPAIGHFRCSDERLNVVYDMSRWTARLCSDDIFVDCPTYEQAFWVGDAYVMSQATSSLFGAEPLIQRCLTLAAQSLDRSPAVESQVPSGWSNILSTWNLLWALACVEHADRTGDIAFAELIYPALQQQTLHYRQLLDEPTGLVRSSYWNLLDWADIDAPAGAIVTHVNAWFAESCRRIGMLAGQLGRNEDAAEFGSLSEALKDRLNVHLWDSSRQAFADCLHTDGSLSPSASEQTQLVCWINDIPSPERREALLRFVRGEATDTVRSATPFMRYFKLQALEQAGMIDALLREIRDVWGAMADSGSTTCWEDMPGRWSPGYPTRSYCHGWSVAPAYFLPRIVGGIGDIEAGSKSVAISPSFGDLRWADSCMMSPYGKIAVAWERTEQDFLARIRLPPGMTGCLRVPMDSWRVKALTLNGRSGAVGTHVVNGFWIVPLEGGSMSVVRASASCLL